MATAACMCFAFNSYAATKTKQTKSNTSTKPVVVNNKTSQFDEVFSDLGAKTADTTSADLAERVRQQRALLDGKGNSQSVAKASGVTGANACDATLRKCMAEKCGSDFTKCAKDSTAIWGDKMDSCRRKTKCTGHEYSLLAPEILADRDFNERMSYYNSVISCGNRYNSCIFAECGIMLEKCLSKSDGDRAVSKCAPVAKDCKEQDSGMAARVMSVFGDLRTVAMAQAEKDEKRLYELRDLMRNQCNRLGAVFDERTLDCVYTVNFFAGDNTSTPTSSKKLYAGDSFQCNANWFGVDVTTFKENAYRRTRAQTSASSAMMGAGVGVAAGLLSSGAIDRALDTQRAEKAAKEECQNSGYTWEKGTCNKDKPYTGNKNNNDDDDEETGEEVTDDSGNNDQSGNENQQNLEQECTEKGRKYANGSCTTECLAEGYEYDSTSQTCNEHSNANELFLYCSGFEEESTCDTDKCEWNDNCVPKSAPRQNISTDETPTQTPVAPGKNVNISLQVTDKTQTVKLMAEIKCGTKTAKTPALGKKITLKNIASTETCVISATDCESKKFQAGVLAQGSQKFLVCPKIDECITNGGKWKNNKCSGANVTATNSCELTPQAICGQGIQRGKCEWNGTKCVEKKNSSVTPPNGNSNRQNGSANGGGAQSCNLDFTSLAKNLKLDTPISLSNCNENTAQYITGTRALEKACYNYQGILVLRSDNTTVSEYRVEPKIENNSFVCKFKNWWDVKDPNGRFKTPDEWDTETHPSDTECATTCNQIKSVTDPTKNILAFPGEKQCLKVCTSNIQTACEGLIGKKDGDAPITKIYVQYHVNNQNNLMYHCQYGYQR